MRKWKSGTKERPKKKQRRLQKEKETEEKGVDMGGKPGKDNGEDMKVDRKTTNGLIQKKLIDLKTFTLNFLGPQGPLRAPLNQRL